MKLGRIIANARSRHGATLQDLSDETGISRGNIQKIESGYIVEPSFRVIAKLARCLNLSLDDLAGEDVKGEGQ